MHCVKGRAHSVRWENSYLFVYNSVKSLTYGSVLKKVQYYKHTIEIGYSDSDNHFFECKVNKYGSDPQREYISRVAKLRKTRNFRSLLISTPLVGILLNSLAHNRE